MDRDLGPRFSEHLREAGVQAIDHDSYFPDDTPDMEWITRSAEEGWVALSRNTRITKTPHELQTVYETRAYLVLIVGQAAILELAENFVATIGRLQRYVRKQEPPCVLRLSRPAPVDETYRRRRPGTVTVSCPPWDKLERMLARMNGRP